MQDFVTPVVLEVEVDVGHLFALQVEETLKDQPVFQWVDVGYAQAVQGHTGGGATADSIQDTALSDEVDDVPDHQEVVGEPGVADHIQLVAEPVYGLRGRVGVTAPEAFFAQLRQIFIGVHLVGCRIFGQMGLTEIQVNVAHVGDQLGVLQRGHKVWEKLGHLRGTLYVIGVVLHTETLLIIDGGTGLDADIDILQRRFHLVHVVSVVGDDQGNIQLPAHGDQAFVNLGKIGDVLVALYL